ncbi:MAG: type VI secretion system protein TssA [Bacteroidetes bacterium]|nr:type VI secretion system protein TssA [Bacteroidota bacterium]
MPVTEESVISEFVQDYLEPISSDSPAGNDAKNEEEYFKLNMEIPKTSPDYKICIELADVILKEQSKDIKVATWLCFALFRTEKIKGLRDGLSIIYHLLNKFENNLFPSNNVHRSKAIQFINSTRFYKLVEREEINSLNANDLIEAENIFSKIIDESKKLFPENVPVLKAIAAVLKSHVEEAKTITSPKKEEKGTDKEEMAADADTIENSEQKVETTTKQIIEEKKKVPSTLTSTPPSTQAIKHLSEKDSISQLRQILTFFFEIQEDGVKKERVPDSHFVFGLSRILQWGKLSSPPDTNKITQIEAPNQIIRGKIKEWFESNDWDTLIPRIEINFLKADSVFRYWFDVQRYLVKALEQKGGKYIFAAEEIKIQLARLLNRIPDLLTLKFKDNKTPFADDETILWINDEVMSILGKGKSSESVILPPIIGEDYDSINKEYEIVCSELPGKFEENLAMMQKAIDADVRRKGKFLRRLNFANYCIQAKQFHLAKVNLFELKDLIEEYNLANWEPALCTAVWQSLYLTNKKLLSGSIDEEAKIKIDKEQKELFSNIAKYDGILAIKLTQKNK